MLIATGLFPAIWVLAGGAGFASEYASLSPRPLKEQASRVQEMSLRKWLL
jgi:hypothetical protein